MKRFLRQPIGPFQGNTSHPILFIGNVADNTTPLRNAFLNAEGFANASVLVSDSYGVSMARDLE
jgi:hypothetical protein